MQWNYRIVLYNILNFGNPFCRPKEMVPGAWNRNTRVGLEREKVRKAFIEIDSSTTERCTLVRRRNEGTRFVVSEYDLTFKVE